MTYKFVAQSVAAAAALAVSFGALAQGAKAPSADALAAAFKRADADADGKLSKEESARMPAVAEKFGELDSNKDGFLSMAEFTAGFEAPKQ
jgi:Ca2+-binding EF-hand superfamily protein